MTSLVNELLDDIESQSSDDDQKQQPISEVHSPSASPSFTGTDDIDTTALLHTLDTLQARLCKQTPQPTPTATTTTTDPHAYALALDCASAIATIDETQSELHRLLITAYNPRFPELSTLIPHPLDYARVAKQTLHHDDLSTIDFRPILPSASVITVQVTASATKGTPLSASQRTHVSHLANLMLSLDDRRSILLNHIISHAKLTAPNLTALVGGAVAAHLLATAGGLTPLARLPSGTVKLLGRNAPRPPTSTTTTNPTTSNQTPSPTSTTPLSRSRQHEGHLHTASIITSLPPNLRNKAAPVLAGKATLAARIDAARTHRDGSYGATLREALTAKFTAWQERPPARTAKPLPIPGDEAKRRHRGGARARKERERFGLTEIRRLANRVAFGKAEVIVGNDLDAEGVGLLGSGSGGSAGASASLRVRARKTDSASAAGRRKLEKARRREGSSEAQQLDIEDSFVIALQGNGDNGRGNEASNGVAGSTTGEANGGKNDGEKRSYFAAGTPFLGVSKRHCEIAKTNK